jgi:dihydroorotase
MTRRELLGSIAAGISPAATFAQPARLYDILIKGGEVCDPARGFRHKADVAIRQGTIAAIEPEIDADRALDVIDAAERFVTPGLVDLHTHIHYGVRSGIEADPVAARSGTTTWLDAGTFAYTEVRGFRRFIVEPAKCRIFGLVHLYPSNRNPDRDPVKDVRDAMDRTGRAAQENSDIVLGVKLQVGSNMNGRYSLDFLKIARELCDKYKLRLMVHISLAPPSTDEVMALMRPGDIITHCYNTHTIGILDEKSRVKPSVRDARARGVLFDVGHGSGSFNFDIARKALNDGFAPDSISTDIYSDNIRGPVYDLPTTLSKLMHAGMSFDDVLKCATANPGGVITPLAGAGTLRVGGPADIALLSVDKGQFPLVDAQRNRVIASQRITSHLTICRGKRLLARA